MPQGITFLHLGIYGWRCQGCGNPPASGTGIVVRRGEKATSALTSLIGDAMATCKGDTRDRYGRLH